MKPSKIFTALGVTVTFAIPSFAGLWEASGSDLAVQPVQETIAQAGFAEQSTAYVNPQQGTDAASAGKSTATPFRTITYALQQAQPGTVIQLAPGQYQSGETFPLQLKPGVTLKGDESQQGQGVVITGGGMHLSPSFRSQNATLLAAETSQIIGVTVTNPNKRGTGIWVESTNPTIRNSTFVSNKREGIFVAGTADPKIENNRFLNNSANGISVTGSAKGEIRGNLFQQTGFGLAIGGTSAPLVENNQIRDNRDGLVLAEEARPIVRGNVIENNKEYGLVAIAQAQPDLGTNDFRSNKQDQFIASQAKTQTLAANSTTTIPATPDQSSGTASTPPDESSATVPPSDQSSGTTSSPASDSTVASTAVQPQGSEVTSFGCVSMGSGFATIAQRGNASIPQPMITWNRSLGTEFSPQRRCESVTQRLNELVLKNGGTLENLLFTAGPINRSLGVCLVKDITSGCNNKNLVFTLSRENAQNATEVLRNLLAFSVTGSGNPVQESEGQPYAALAPVAQRLAPADGLWFVKSGR